MANEDLTTEDLLERMKQALREDGDFPASAKVVNQLRLMITNPNATAHQLSEIILQEPSLGMRILHLVNSSFYRRAKPITTVSQAVVQIGLRPLAELCSGLVLLQKFVPRARQSSPFANCLKQNITTSLFTATLSAEMADDGSVKNEQGFLAGSFACLGTLLLGYYFPNVYQAAEKRAQEKEIDIATSIQEITGLTPYQISQEVMTDLELPEFFKSVVSDASNLASGSNEEPKATAATSQQAGVTSIDPNLLTQAVFAAQELGEAFVDHVDPRKFEDKIERVSSVTGLDRDIIYKSVEALSELFNDQCAALELKMPIPKNLSVIANDNSSSSESGSGDSMQQAYFDEIRMAIENGEPTATVVTTVMEALKSGLHFERVLLLLRNSEKTHLQGRIMLGQQKGFDPKTFKSSLNPGPGTIPIDLVAFREGQAIFKGEPLVGNTWPIAAIPIGPKGKAIGVIYVEGAVTSESELDPARKDAVLRITQLLKQSLLGTR